MTLDTCSLNPGKRIDVFMHTHGCLYASIYKPYVELYTSMCVYTQKVHNSTDHTRASGIQTRARACTQAVELEALRKQLSLQETEHAAVTERLRARGRELDERENDLAVRERALAARRAELDADIQGTRVRDFLCLPCTGFCRSSIVQIAYIKVLKSTFIRRRSEKSRKCTYIHACIHTYIHTYIHTCNVQLHLNN